MSNVADVVGNHNKAIMDINERLKIVEESLKKLKIENGEQKKEIQRLSSMLGQVRHHPSTVSTKEGRGRSKSARGSSSDTKKRERQSSNSKKSNKGSKNRSKSKSALSKLPKDLLTTDERAKYTEAIKKVKVRLDKKEWEELTPIQKYEHSLKVKEQVQNLDRDRKITILKRAQEKERLEDRARAAQQPGMHQETK